MFTISKRHSGCKWKMMNTSSYTQILEVHHFEPSLAQSPHTQWRDLRLTWGSKGKKVGWKLEGGWTWLGPPSKFQHIWVPTRNLNLTLLLVITKGPRGLKFLGKPLDICGLIYGSTRRHPIKNPGGRLRFQDFQISETPEATKLGSKTRLFGIPPDLRQINMGGDMKNPFFKVEKRL